jgi:hypothetical protein
VGCTTIYRETITFQSPQASYIRKITAMDHEQLGRIVLRLDERKRLRDALYDHGRDRQRGGRRRRWGIPNVDDRPILIDHEVID